MICNDKISTWDEGLQSGNGSIGCLVWGAEPLKFSIDSTAIWDTAPAPQTLTPEFTYENLINLLKKGDFEHEEQIFGKCYRHITPTKLLGGRIEMDFGPTDDVCYELDRKKPIIKTELKLSGGERIATESFISAVADVGVIKITGNTLPKITVVRPSYGKTGEKSENAKRREVSHGNAADLLYPEPEIINEADKKGFIQPTNEDFKYALLLKSKKAEDGLLIAYTLACGRRDEDFGRLVTLLDEFLNRGYEAAVREHLEWWENYYSQSDIEIADEALQDIWDTSNYLLACVSRKGALPMPLQGVFTADDGSLPPWKGDYHNDTNTQMSYYSYLKANHLEQGVNFPDFLYSLLPRFKRFAKEFFDAEDAISVPGVMSVKGDPMGGWAIYSLSITNVIWLCRNLEDYYEYTLDRDYLENKLYPFMVGVERCIKRWLVTNDEGKLQLAFSGTPEWRDHSAESCFFENNTNYDLMLLHYLYEKLEFYSEMLELKAEADYYKDICERLNGYYTDDSGFMISKDLPLTDSHRHHSHLMAIHPLRTVDMDNGRELIMNSLRHLEEKGMSYWVGFSFTWASEMYTIAHNGEAAAYMLKLFYENLCLPNGFHANGDYKHRGITVFRYRPVTLEANMAAMSAVQEMLLYSEKGVIEVFPAIPKHMAQKGAAFKTLRAKGALLVSSSIKNGRVEYIRIKSLAGGKFTVRLPREMELTAAGEPIMINSEKCVYEFKKGEEITLM